MLETLLDLTHPSALFGIYVSVLLGVTIYLVRGIVLEQEPRSYVKKTEATGAYQLQIDRVTVISFFLRDWLAHTIRRKEGSGDDGEDHSTPFIG